MLYTDCNNMVRKVKNNIKTATIVWLILVAMVGLLLFDLRLIGAFDADISAVAKVLLGAVLIVFLMTGMLISVCW